MSLSPRDAVAVMARRLAQREPGDVENAAEIRKRLPALVRALVDKYGARRVVLVGSIARGMASDDADEVFHDDRPAAS